MESIKLEKLEILLDYNKTKYRCGETISGTVKLKLLKSGQYIQELDLSVVNIVLRTLSEVKWTENPGTVHFREGHIYYDSYQDIDVIYDIRDKISKPGNIKGEHEIPFNFELPDKVPPSVNTPHGFISYWIEVIIKNEKWSPNTFQERKDITIESSLSENRNLSVGGGAEKELGLLNMGSGKVRIDASLTKKSHLPGETVEVHCLVTNTSTVAVTPRVSFYQTQIFMANDRHKSVQVSIEPVVGKKVNAGETSEQTIEVVAPKHMPLSLKTRLITIKYFIHVTLEIPHSLDLHLNLPIILTDHI